MPVLKIRIMWFMALVACVAISGEPAAALGIRNCTDSDIRVSVFKGSDKVKLIPVRGGKAAIRRGKLHDFRLGKGGFVIRVYGPKKLTLHLMESSRLKGNAIYTIRGRNGHYNVNSANDCPPAKQALMPAGGLWVTKRNGEDHYLRIRRSSPSSFVVRHQPNGAEQTFEFLGGHRFTNGYTASIEVQSETRLVEINHLLGDSEEVYRFVRP